MAPPDRLARAGAGHSTRGEAGEAAPRSRQVFNLLDDGTYQIYNPFFERGIQVNGTNEAQRRFGRRWQLGMKLAF